VSFIHDYYKRHQLALSQIYDEESELQFRASNLCNLIFGLGLVFGLLLAFAILIDVTTVTPKRLFYMFFLSSMLLVLNVCLRLTKKGRFLTARFVFMMANTIFIVPAVLLTGGLPASASMVTLPLPILYSFCLYRARESVKISAVFLGVIVLMLTIPNMIDLNLPNYANGELYQRRKLLTFLILIVMLLFTLVSLQYENQRAVKRARAASQAKSEFLANMSHEIRTPMNGVLGITNLLLKQPMPEDQKNMLQIVSSSGDALLTIINDILDFSKLDAGQVTLDSKPFSIENILRDIGQLLKHSGQEKGLYLTLQYAPNCPKQFIGDDGRVRQILLNIIGNAMKFTETGGVNIMVEMDTDGYLQIAVKDTGIGICPDKQDSLFQQFSQADNSTTRVYGGTGLGLSISQKLAHVMGGNIDVESALGEGSTFTVRLPLPIATAENTRTDERAA